MDMAKDADATPVPEACEEPLLKKISPKIAPGAVGWKEQLPMRIYIGYVFGHVMNDMTASLWFTYILMFLEKHAEISEVNAGIVFLTGQVIDAIFNPVAGIAIDKIPFESSRIYYVIFGSVGVAASFSMLWFVPDFLLEYDEGWRVCWYSGWAGIFNVFWSFVQVAHFSLVDELAKTTELKLSLNKLGQMGSACAAIVTFALARFAFHLPMDYENQFTTLVLCVLVIGSIALSIFAALLIGSSSVTEYCQTVELSETGRYRDDMSDAGADADAKLLAEDDGTDDGDDGPGYCHYFTLADFYEAISLYTCSRMIMIITMTFLAPYLAACSNHEQGMQVSALAMVCYHSCYCVSVVSEYFCCKSLKRSGDLRLRSSYIVLSFGSGILALIFYALNPIFKDGSWIHAVYLPMSFAGVVAYYLVATSRTLVNGVSGKHNSAFVIGVAGFVEKAVIGAVVILVQDSERRRDDGYWWSISLFPAAVAALSIILAVSFCIRMKLSAPADTDGQTRAKDR